MNVITVHDVANKKNNLYHSLLYRLYIELFIPSSLKRSNKIITISNSAKNDIIECYKINPGKIIVIYRYADKKFTQFKLANDDIIKLQNKYKLPDKFILYVGVIENRKNF